jgi:hypothetical protein
VLAADLAALVVVSGIKGHLRVISSK